MSVIAGKNESIESLIKRYKKMVEREGIVRDWRKHEFYEKPSVIRHREKQAAERKYSTKKVKPKRKKKRGQNDRNKNRD